jgi:hypothetical protein
MRGFQLAPHALMFSSQAAAAQLGDVLLAAQAFQHDTDLLFRRVLPARLAPDVFDDLVCRRSRTAPSCDSIIFNKNWLS